MAGKHLDRRTFLRGLGSAIALPMLDAMVPAFAATRNAAKAPCRMAFAYVPNGIIMQDFTPASAGADYEFTRILKPLSGFREDFMVLTGLNQENGRALGDGPGDHARAASTFLTGVHPKKTAGADIHVGTSVDQVAAAAIGKQAQFASLELGCEDGRLVGNCDSGYSCAYSNSISWRTPTTPNPPEINPRQVFERLFGQDDDPATRARRAVYNKSILDFVSDDTRKLENSLGATDRRKLDEYLTAVREIEQRIEAAERSPRKDFHPDMERPLGVPLDYREHVRTMFDLMALAFQTDLTRVATIMMAREGSNRAYREIGITDAHHGLSHHRGATDNIEKLTQINTFHIEQFAYFLGKLKSIKDGEGTLLDNSMIVYGSGLSDGNRHSHTELPCILAGRGVGTIKTGRHVRIENGKPMNNLFLSMLDRMGVQTESLGDANGKLEHLAEL